MRGILVFIASGLGLGAFWRRRSQRGPAYEAGYQYPSDDEQDPARELRAKLAETKATHDHDPALAEPAEAETSPLDPQARRRDVHERARASIDELG